MVAPLHIGGLQGDQVSISPIFSEQLFVQKFFCTAFMCLQFGFVMFWQKDFGAQAAHKMLVKLTPDWAKFCLSGFFFKDPSKCLGESVACCRHFESSDGVRCRYFGLSN
jgi:hypothetical protein